MKKISILTLTTGYGGISKTTCLLANLLSQEYDITIVSAYQVCDYSVYDLNRNVKILYLKKDLKPNKKEINDYYRNHKYIKWLKELYKGFKILKEKKKLMIDYIKTTSSNIVISTNDSFNIWLSKYGNQIEKKIVINQNDYSDINYVKNVVKSCKKIDYFVTVLEEQYKFYQPYLKEKCVYIPNYLDIIPNKISKNQSKRLLYVGRLSKDKHLDDLLDVFKIVNEKYNDWVLDIVGGGNEYNKISKRIQKENLKVNLHGFQDSKNLKDIYLNSSIYISTSSNEIFNMSILEALSYGLVCVAFDRSLGVKNLISDNWDGYLVKYSDKEKMVRRILELIENENRRIIMGRNASKKALKYNKDEIKEKWEKIINN